MIINGGPDDETLTGTAGDDVIDGGGGADTMIGLAGNDRYYVDNAGDQVIEAAGGGSDTVYANVDYALWAGEEIEFLRTNVPSGLTLTGNERANYMIGASGSDTLNGGGGSDTLDGGAGADVMAGGSGNDFYHVDNAGDQVIEAAGGGSDNVYAHVDFTLGAGQEIEFLRVYGPAGRTLTGNELANYLLGGGAGDALNGGGGDDRLDGGLGGDTMAGGSGNDVYYVDNAGDQVVEAAGGGSDNVYSSVGYTLAAGQEVEFLRVYGAAALTLTGNELANYLIGNAGGDTLAGGGGNDTLDGRAGADAMAGGAGNDFYYVDNTGDRVIEAAGGGSDNVYASVGYTLAAGQEVEFLRVNGSSGLALTGNEFANALFGAAGDDTLDGGLGADTMTGGGGDDAYHVDNAGDRVIEAAGGGDSDILYASVDYTLAAGQEVEFLYSHGSGIALTGNELVNHLNGQIGNDILDGGGGADTMAGLGDDDTYYVDDAADFVYEQVGDGSDTIYASISYTLAAGQEVEFLRVRGDDGLALTGNDFGMEIVGGAGSDALTGGAGNDIVTGGGDSTDTLNGGADDDHLIRRGGADILDGGAGADVMNAGDFSSGDTFYVDNAGDQIAGQVFQATIYASSDWTVSGGVDGSTVYGVGSIGLHLTGTSGINTLVGTSGDDVLTGGSFVNTLDGGAGADTLIGGYDADYFHVDNTGDQVFEAISDNIIGKWDKLFTSVDYTLAAGQEVEVMVGEGATGLHLTGNELGMEIDGGNGGDTLTGGAANDILAGRSGDDTFVFGSPLGSKNIDTITDFDGTSEIIRLDHAVFAGLMGRLTTAQFSLNAAAGAAPQIVYNTASGALSYASGGTQVQFAVIENHATLSAANFVAF